MSPFLFDGGKMIKINNVTKTYENNEVIKGIDLTITKGEIFGIIGSSGAGKSTLVRMINGLESITSGDIIVDGQSVGNLTENKLNLLREEIGFVFQNFNLLSSLTVFENIALALNQKKLSKKELETKISGVLRLVGLEGKEKYYPKQLSGGQKQRVGIARSLIRNPKLLLCDEATSALDPETTKSILELLTSINKDLNLTIIIITHEMDVVKDLCDRVAVIENGEIVELNRVDEIFTNPQALITQKFVNSIINPSGIEQMIDNFKENDQGLIVKLKYTSNVTNDTLVYEIATVTQAEFTIIGATVNQTKYGPFGYLYIGFKTNLHQVENYLEINKIENEVL